MKIFDFGVEFFFGISKWLWRFSFINEKTCHSGVQKVFYQKFHSYAIRFAVFEVERPRRPFEIFNFFLIS
jgi:hypothetical protein